MKKFILAFAMMGFLSACATSADSSIDVVYPSVDFEIETLESKPYIIEIEEEYIPLDSPTVEVQNGQHHHPNGVSFVSGLVSEGETGTVIKKYALAYNMHGVLLSKTELPDEEVVIETTPTIYADYQPVVSGNYYTSSRVTRYGYDCYGCNHDTTTQRGGTSAGIQIGYNEVRQKDGSWSEGITYEGYYIIATSQSIPLCTVVEISNHTISGYGIQSGVPFKAIVLDRGGAITGSKVDLFIGSESDPTVKMGRKKTLDVEIISLNKRTRTNGVFNCNV